MTTILNITNGDSSVHIMSEGAIPGVYLPWRDVLHEGPVPVGLSLTELSKVRANFIAAQGWGDINDVQAGFDERDTLLNQHQQFDEVILWFEHDLYDQLQILQILDWLCDHRDKSGSTQYSMICTDNYLGYQTPQQMRQLVRYKQPITDSQIQLAKRSWQAFCEPTAVHWSGLLAEDLTALPFLKNAILRHCQEYPDVLDGLSRTLRMILEIVSESEISAAKLFGRYQQKEDAKFMGDTTFWQRLDVLLGSEPAFIALVDESGLKMPEDKHAVVQITQAGRALLAGTIDAHGLLNQGTWMGGVQLTLNANWCWDNKLKTLTNRG